MTGNLNMGSQNITSAGSATFAGDLTVNGQIDTWGQVVVVNGAINGTGSIGIYGSGSVQQVDFVSQLIEIGRAHV